MRSRTCTSCRHQGYIEAVRLRRYYARHMKLGSLEHRLRCTACGTRGAVSWTPVRQKL
ncbi:hypothetical protein [Albidovulum aquaemixtae]|uniref:hypothetical protein n=1 Tax=Albidovulum aquaemixtae TaxID=1542388 RepID=UPI0015E7FDEC|nr:hypothetical protein [Defluviimonas aquaemixtae]